MDQHRFDSLVRSLGTRRSRRSALQAGAAALAGTAFAAGAVNAQGTPTAGEEAAADDATLFVQTASGGTFLPNTMASPEAGAHGDYLLTLSGHAGQTIGFSNRPQRDFGQVDTETFLDQLGFTPDNPANAALVVSTPSGEDDILVIELLNPSYEAEAGLLLYEANILAEYSGEGLAPIADRQQDLEIATEFDHASLFIDDCPDADPLYCYAANCETVGHLGTQIMCWRWDDLECEPCNGYWNGTADMCNQRFPEQCQGKCKTQMC